MVEQVIYTELKNLSPGLSEFIVFQTLEQFRQAMLATMKVCLGENIAGEEDVLEETVRIEVLFEKIKQELDQTDQSINDLANVLNKYLKELDHLVLYEGPLRCWPTGFKVLTVTDQVSSGDQCPLIFKQQQGQKYHLYPGHWSSSDPPKVDFTSDSCGDEAIYFSVDLGELVYGDDYICGCEDCC